MSALSAATPMEDVPATSGFADTPHQQVSHHFLFRLANETSTHAIFGPKSRHNGERDTSESEVQIKTCSKFVSLLALICLARY
eukprot:3608910-Amphidinium_carterae.1